VLTRCPECATHFRVTAEQLKARSGRVRCGQCQHVFNALDSLIEEPTLAIPAGRHESPPMQEMPPLPSGGGAHTANHAGILPSDPSGEGIVSGDTADVPDAAVNEAHLLSTAGEHDEEPVDSVTADAAVAPVDVAPLEAEPLPPEPVVAEPESFEQPVVDSPEPDVDAESGAEPGADSGTETTGWSEAFPEPKPRRRWPWAIGSALALTAICLQVLIAFRVELAVLSPAARPSLSALCELAGCEVALPAKIGLVGIEASDLHPDTGRKGGLELTATLKNRAPFAQQFPHLELTLTDTADKAVARKVLTPADYLPARAAITDGMQPNADVAVTVGIDPGEIAASGYRLYLFYP